jgi:hypothetical protein
MAGGAAHRWAGGPAAVIGGVKSTFEKLLHMNLLIS